MKNIAFAVFKLREFQDRCKTHHCLLKMKEQIVR